MARGKKPGGFLGAAQAATASGRSSAAQDRVVAQERDEARGKPIELQISKVVPRANDARALKEEHAQDLADSIKVLGLLQPILVDKNQRLIAGAHRLRAFQILLEREGDRWATIPAIIQGDVDAEREPDRVLQMEIAENEKRRNFTKAEVKTAASRFLGAGFIATKGRPKKGERPLGPALAATFGISARYVRQILNEEEAPKAPARDTAEDRRKQLTGLLKYVRRASRGLEGEVEIYSAAQALDEAITRALEEG